MSNLVDHAKRELALLHPGESADELQKLIEDFVVETVQKFSEMGHSGSSAAYTTGVLTRLLEFRNLRGLTNDPNEWIEVGDGLWQNVRNSEAFSTNGGETYTLLSERGGDDPQPAHTSEAVH